MKDWNKSGWLGQTGQGLWFEQIAEQIASSTGRRVSQKQRGVTVWG